VKNPRAFQLHASHSSHSSHSSHFSSTAPWSLLQDSCKTELEKGVNRVSRNKNRGIKGTEALRHWGTQYLHRGSCSTSWHWQILLTRFGTLAGFEPIQGKASLLFGPNNLLFSLPRIFLFFFPLCGTLWHSYPVQS
jgi:hypothetical protein